MEHEDYIKKRDKIYDAIVDGAWMNHAEAAQAIDALVLEVIGDNKTYQTATTDELKQGWHIYVTENKLRDEQRRIVKGEQS